MEQEMLFHYVVNHTATTTMTNDSVTGTCLVIAGYVVIALAILLHIFGIMVIIIKSSEMCNQLLLLMHLSFVSIIMLAVITFSVYKHSNAIRAEYKIWIVMLYYVMQIVYVCNLVLLTLDRLFVTFFDIRYRVIVTRCKLFVAIAAVWILAIGYGVIVKFSSDLNYSISAREKVSLAYSGFTVAFTFVTYVVIFVKVKCMASKLRANHSVSRDEFRKRLIPFLMVLGFFIFCMMPSIIEKQMYSSIKSNSPHARTLMISLIDMQCLNHLLDPFIYIFFQRRIRKKLKALCCLFTKSRYQYIRACRKMASISSERSSNRLNEIGIDNKCSVETESTTTDIVS